MSGKTQFWLGSLMLALAVGALIGGLLYPRPSYSGDGAEGRSGNFALVTSTLTGTKPRSQIVYVIDDRNEVLYVIEASAIKGEGAVMRDHVDLREASTLLLKERAKKETHANK